MEFSILDHCGKKIVVDNLSYSSSLLLVGAIVVSWNQLCLLLSCLFPPIELQKGEYIYAIGAQIYESIHFLNGILNFRSLWQGDSSSLLVI